MSFKWNEKEGSPVRPLYSLCSLLMRKVMEPKFVLLLMLAYLALSVSATAAENCSAYTKNQLYKKVSCFQKRADNGDAVAQNVVGSFFAQGKGVKQDYFEAMKWFRKSAEQGDSDAQLNLGVMYATGRGVSLNDKRAYQWFLKSAAKDNKNAREYVVKLLLMHKNDPLSIAEDGQAALSVAFIEGNRELAKLLVDKGATFDQSNESLHMQQIDGLGPSGRFTLDDIRPSTDGPGGRFTLSIPENASDDSSFWEMKMEKQGDFMRINNNNPVVYAADTLIRFRGKISFNDYIFDGAEDDPFAFYLTKKYGLVYLRGSGIVVLKTGEKVTLNTDSVNIAKLLGDANNAPVNVASPGARSKTTLPDNGYVFFKQSKNPVAPLEIVTKNQNYHYYVKISEADTNITEQAFFLRSGGTVKTMLPLGTYLVKYATGQNWQGEKELFGEDTLYNKADRTFTFTQNKKQASGFRIELILQTDGNLRTRKIKKAEW